MSKMAPRRSVAHILPPLCFLSQYTYKIGDEKPDDAGSCPNEVGQFYVVEFSIPC